MLDACNLCRQPSIGMISPAEKPGPALFTSVIMLPAEAEQVQHAILLPYCDCCGGGMPMQCSELS
eukprot:CAMPEP_0180819820 /NCGR_PEP_ID=MMETSP1038_2-20121128/69943_1 /TAXON_ID=632150 /ORGANISM="Azadinium spinosum, Strain 3D9" /LENGTH=64 /DNA_ID=CAMNT_0022861845 /DNA_START=576 /DNA_END=770 /DNA_ORIENTATION=+